MLLEICENSSNTMPLNMEKLAHMESSELVDFIKHYAVENEALRKQNSELLYSRDILLRDHEFVCRDYERILKKLDNPS